jgi:plastocyanin
MRRILLSAGVIVLVATSCGSGRAPQGTTGRTPPVTLSGTVNDHGTKDLAGATELEVEQDDFYFEPTFVKGAPGATVMVELDNEGTLAHTFTIDALSVDKEVKPGEKAEVAVTLPSSGVVSFYCRFHRDRGMQGAFFFTAGGSGGTTPTQTTSGYGSS